MNKSYSYPATLDPQEEGGYVVEFSDFPEAITQGDSIEEALDEAKDCLEEVIANRFVKKLDMPEASNLKEGQYLIAIHFKEDHSTMTHDQLRKILSIYAESGNDHTESIASFVLKILHGDEPHQKWLMKAAINAATYDDVDENNPYED